MRRPLPRKPTLPVRSRHAPEDACRRRAAPRRISLFLAPLASCLATLPACLSTPDIKDQPYDGPPVTIGAGRDYWIVTVEAPTPGHDLDLDLTRDRLDAQQVFVTLRQPDPDQTYAQVIAPMSLQTTVRRTRRIEVFAREVPHDAATAIEGRPFRPAASRDPAPSE